MGVRITPVNSLSLSIPNGPLSRPYKFKWGEWTEITDTGDLEYLLRHTSTIFREEKPLAKTVIVPNSSAPRTVKYNDGRWSKKLHVPPEGKPQVFENYEARMLLRNGYGRLASLSEVLGIGKTAKILVTRGGGLGDVLLTTPSMKEARKRYPQIRLTYRCSDELKTLLQGCPGVERVVGTFEAYDYAPFDFEVDLSGVVERSDLQHLHRIDIFADFMGVGPVTDRKMYINVRDEDRAWAREVIRSRSEGKKTIIFQAFNPRVTRIPSEAKLRKIASMLWDHGWFLVYVAPQSVPTWGELPGINLCGSTSVGQLMGLIAEADLVVCGDSGPLHAANAMNKPVVALFGPVDPAVRVSDSPKCITLRANDVVNCGPCNDHQTKICPSPVACLEAIDNERVIQAVEEVSRGA